MEKKSNTFKTEALVALKGRWLSIFFITLVYGIINRVIPFLLNLFVFEPLGNFVQLCLLPIGYGFSIIFLEMLRTPHKEFEITVLFEGFKEYERIFSTLFLTGLYTLLWSFAFIIPGIIKSYSYAMVPYILKDHPNLSGNAVIERSVIMMEGHKMELFCLHLSFIGWISLSILTLGLGFLWLLPYINTAQACFYEEIKNDFTTKDSMTIV